MPVTMEWGRTSRELLITLTFEEEKGGTRMTLVHSGYSELTQEDAAGMSQGWNESFDKLEAELKKYIASH